jgi:signal transduction histidine kinase/FixJ family two-component response regulator
MVGTILVVDDSESVLALSREALEALGHAVVFARTGAEALAWLKEHPASLALLDYRLPDMTGRDIVRILSAEGVNLPFVTITAHGDEQIAVEMMKLGALDYLVKDEAFAELLPTVVGQALERLATREQLRAAEEALRKSEQRFRRLSEEFQTLLDGIPDVLMLLSPQRNVIWANRAAQELPAPPGAEGDHGCWALCGEPRTGCAECPVPRSFLSGSLEEDVIRSPGGRVWGVKVFPLKDSGGAVAKAILLASDITEKLSLREEADRAGRLAAVGELAAGVAHEINNPTGLILMNMPVLIEAFADARPILEAQFRSRGDFPFGGVGYSRIREQLPLLMEEMLDGARRIRQIVDDLKDFARGGQGDDLREFDLNGAVSRAIRLVDNQIRKSTDCFVCRYSPGLPPVRGNSQRIEQVLVNLLLNACQALPDKTKGLQVAVQFDARANLCQVTVRDEGVGIPPENLPHLTDPFFTTRRASGGTGLGLSVSDRIVREHGGSLQFDSRPGEGTTVILSLPAAPREEEA